tara:strand:- start:8686 stop:9879 length:1194 start_codon:yes stop_codon:yes gene_type:complete
MRVGFDTVICFRTTPLEVDPMGGNFADSSYNSEQLFNRYTLNSEMSFYLDMSEIAELLDAELYNIQLGPRFDIYDVYNRELKKLGKILFIIESWMLQDDYFSLIDLKLCNEECEIIVLAWDDYYQLNNMLNLELANLYLTNDPRSINFLREQLGVKAHFYISTPCKKLIEIINQFPAPTEGRQYDIGCLMSFKHKNEYRSNLKTYLHKHFKNPFLGQATTTRLSTYNIEQTLQEYLQIKVHLGNTSSAWGDKVKELSNKSTYYHPCKNPDCLKPSCSSSQIQTPHYYQQHIMQRRIARCMKGVKDFLAPLLNVVLIYDDYYWNAIFYQDVFPLYEYNNFDTIKATYDEVTKDMETTTHILTKQKEWVKKHSFFNQFKYIIENDQSPFFEHYKWFSIS